MRNLVVIGMIVTSAMLCAATGANAQHRGYAPAPRYAPPAYRPAPQFHPAPMPRYMPQAHLSPGVPRAGIPRYVAPQHFGNVGRHGLPLISGRFGWHEPRNRTHFAMIAPLAGSEGGSPVDFESFVDSIDLSAPLDPVDGCAAQCMWGALSISNDGAAGSAWNYPTADAARAVASQNCASVAAEACNTFVATGTAWIAGIQCDNGSWHLGVGILGNTMSAAISNAFRYMFQSGYSPDTCSIVNLIAADGSQDQYAQQEE